MGSFGRRQDSAEVTRVPNPIAKTPRGPDLRRRPGELPRDHRLPALYRQPLRRAAETASGGELARDSQLALVEAALLAADEPLTTRKLATVAGLQDGNEARRLVRRLQELYGQDRTAFQVEEVAGGFQLFTRPEFHRWLVRLKRGGQDLRLTGPARETLAIIAYRQPIMRAEIEGIRGVHCGDLLRLLMEKGLIRIAGRDDSLGRPVLYGTTKKFLQVFGLKSLKELPEVAELRPKGEAGTPAADE
jgi:segregation and condensation protein B